MNLVEQARTQAAEVLRAARQSQRETEKALGRTSEELVTVVRASVEALETLSSTIGAFATDLGEQARDSIGLAEKAAWERLTRAGIVLDGEVGEKLDLVRHRVARRRRAPTHPPGVIVDVLSPGVVFRTVRVREAVVCISEGEDDATDRD